MAKNQSTKRAKNLAARADRRRHLLTNNQHARCLAFREKFYTLGPALIYLFHNLRGTGLFGGK